MKITWDEFQSYLVIDRKLSAKAGNLAGIRSRFTILMRFFADKPFTDRKKYILDIQESTSILTIRLKKVYA